MRKVLLLIPAVLITVSCALTADPAVTGGNTGPAIAEMGFMDNVPVNFLRANTYVHTKYGMSQLERWFLLRLRNIAYVKNVSVFHKMANGSWTNLPCSYTSAADSGYELWKGGYSKVNGNELGVEFVLRYEVNGQVYWDNNNYANYKVSNAAGAYLGNGINVMLDSVYRSGSNFTGSIDVRNIAYQKAVQVVYTTDNWRTQKVVNATFSSGYSYGYSYSYSPNCHGIERWNFWATEAAPVKFYLRYTVNGVTYYDNNFGRNYSY